VKLEIEPAANPALEQQVRRQLDNLTKPPGSLGRLEELVVQYALARGNARPPLGRKRIYVFCADHGVAAEGVSAYPAAVTAQMVRNFAGGGAAINVLCRQFGIETRIVDMGVNAVFEPELGVVNCKTGCGTGNFTRAAAMSAAQARQAIEAGIALAREAAAESCDLLGAGEMGIGNTTAAAALAAALTGRDPGEMAGLGTGITAAQLERKAEVIRRALALHRLETSRPLEALAAVGGFEIAGMAGLMLGAAAARLPVVVDGFISSAAALVAARLNERVLPYLFFSHCSAERGHRALLGELGAQPLLSLDLRLGEGTGAALAMAMIEAAARLSEQMATFDSAGVAGPVR